MVSFVFSEVFFRVRVIGSWIFGLVYSPQFGSVFRVTDDNFGFWVNWHISRAGRSWLLCLWWSFLRQQRIVTWFADSNRLQNFQSRNFSLVLATGTAEDFSTIPTIGWGENKINKLLFHLDHVLLFWILSNVLIVVYRKWTEFTYVHFKKLFHEKRLYNIFFYFSRKISFYAISKFFNVNWSYFLEACSLPTVMSSLVDGKIDATIQTGTKAFVFHPMIYKTFTEKKGKIIIQGINRSSTDWPFLKFSTSQWNYPKYVRHIIYLFLPLPGLEATLQEKTRPRSSPTNTKKNHHNLILS